MAGQQPLPELVQKGADLARSLIAQGVARKDIIQPLRDLGLQGAEPLTALRAADRPPPPPPAPRHPLEDVGGTVIYESIGRKVIRHAEGDKVTKIATTPILAGEVAAMELVRTRTTIPVPRVYESTENSITMEYIDGKPLEDEWDKLSDADKAAIGDQLRGYIEQLRSIKGSYIGALERRPADIGRYFPLHCGPFDTEAEFNEFKLSRLIGRHHHQLTSMVRSQMRTDHDIVFTHGDLQPPNLLVRDGRVVAIIDWERAGFYPEYWELMQVLRGANFKHGYYVAFLENIFPERWDREYLIDQYFARWLTH